MSNKICYSNNIFNVLTLSLYSHHFLNTFSALNTNPVPEKVAYPNPCVPESIFPMCSPQVI